MSIYPENDYRDYLAHSAKGSHWKEHKYTRIENGNYIYSDSTGKSKFGKYGKGNTDLEDLPIIENEDGTYDTLDTFSVGIDGEEVLLNCIQRGPDGNAVRVSEDEAIDQYMKDGKHLGKFKSAESAASYAKQLDEDQAKLIKERRSNSSSNGKYAVVSGGHHYKVDNIKDALNKSMSTNVIYAPKKKR